MRTLLGEVVFRLAAKSSDLSEQAPDVASRCGVRVGALLDGVEFGGVDPVAFLLGSRGFSVWRIENRRNPLAGQPALDHVRLDAIRSVGRAGNVRDPETICRLSTDTVAQRTGAYFRWDRDLWVDVLKPPSVA